MTSGSSIYLQSKSKREYPAVGIMAGSSMDGLDLVLVSFWEEEKWSYTIHKAEIVPYPDPILRQFFHLRQKNREELQQLDLEFGHWIGNTTRKFVEQSKPDFIALHGHTAIHEPEKGISRQLGSGREIAKLTQTITITGFRNKDISLGGQGAPLVPFGDFELFSEYDACLNLGGIANVSIKDQQRAWDICPCNQVLNFYANQLGKPYDQDGQIGRQGTLRTGFIRAIQELSYFSMPSPKSLPNKYISEQLLTKVSPADGLRSYSTFIAAQTGRDIKSRKQTGKLLVTGGGAWNTFLIEQLKTYLPGWEITIPEGNIVSFKEALIFAFLGLMRKWGKINTYASVTGAIEDSCGGELYLPE